MRYLCTCALLTAMAAAAGADPATQPAPRAADPQAKPMEQIIRDIRNAKDLASAGRDYAEGRNIDRNSVELYKAYLTRTLALGKPNIALYPALELVRLKADKGLASAVVAYNRARQGNYFEALKAAVVAMKHRADDTSVQHNTANLAAWYKRARPRPTLPPEVTKILDQSLDDWMLKRQFSETYAKAEKIFDDRTKRIDQIEELIRRKQRKRQDLVRELKELDDKYRDDERDIRNLWRRVYHYRARLKNVEDDLKTETDPDERLRLRRRRDDLRRDIRDTLREIKDLQDKKDDRNRDQRRLQDEIKDIDADIAKLRAEQKRLGPAQPRFTWHPPAKGKVVPDGDKGDDTEKPDPARADDPAKMLKMAKLLLANDFEDKAVETLRDLIKKHPDSPAAKDAAKMLKNLNADGGN